MLTKVIFINIAVFIFLRLSAVVITLMGGSPDFILEWLSVPASLPTLLERPWTLISYMFVQYDIFHILFNMLWLYWFGTIFMQYFTPKHFFALYLLGGLGGALLYLTFYNIFPFFAGSLLYATLIGASASVIAIVVATAFRAPDYQMGLLFLGSISLKWIALVTILIDIISIDSANAGGHIAHLGGAVVGLIFAMMYKQGKDITAPINYILDKLATIKHRKPSPFKKPKKSKAKAQSSSGKMDVSDEAIMNEILEKIKKSGYASLSSTEKKKLFDVSKKS